MGGSHGVAAVAGPEGTREGLRAIWVSAVWLGVAAALQIGVVVVSGSAALFADALDNLGDVITTIGLAIAFLAARRAADNRYTFGYQRLEDLGGVFVILVIWISAALAAWESYRKLTGEHEVRAIGLAMAAAAFGAVSNEAVARYKIAVGRRIGSQPLIADGAHARTDALASVAAFGGLLGVQLGFEEADPIAGLVITLAIVWIAYDASRHVLARLLDAVDPGMIERIRATAVAVPGIEGVGRVQARWAGRSLYVTITVAADGDLTLKEAHALGDALHHRLIHDLPGVAQVDVHLDPWETHGDEAHPETALHAAGDDAHEHDEHEHGHGGGHVHGGGHAH